MKLYRMNDGDDYATHETVSGLYENIFSKVVGGVAMAMGVAKLLKKKDNYWQVSGLMLGQSVIKREIDPFKRVKEYEGIITMKKGVPHVLIKKGVDKVGQLVQWTPNWIKK